VDAAEVSNKAGNPFGHVWVSRLSQTTSHGAVSAPEAHDSPSSFTSILLWPARPRLIWTRLIVPGRAPYPERDSVGWLGSPMPVRGDWRFNPTALKLREKEMRGWLRSTGPAFPSDKVTHGLIKPARDESARWHKLRSDRQGAVSGG
jgi:hypothetical protein